MKIVALNFEHKFEFNKYIMKTSSSETKKQKQRAGSNWRQSATLPSTTQLILLIKGWDKHIATFAVLCDDPSNSEN